VAALVFAIALFVSIAMVTSGLGGLPRGTSLLGAMFFGLIMFTALGGFLLAKRLTRLVYANLDPEVLHDRAASLKMGDAVLFVVGLLGFVWSLFWLR
jgi:hypothetical protein